MTELEQLALITQCRRILKSSTGPLKYHVEELQRLKQLIAAIDDKYPPKPILEPENAKPTDN